MGACGGFAAMGWFGPMSSERTRLWSRKAMIVCIEERGATLATWASAEVLRPDKFKLPMTSHTAAKPAQAAGEGQRKVES